MSPQGIETYPVKWNKISNELGEQNLMYTPLWYKISTESIGTAENRSA